MNKKIILLTLSGLLVSIFWISQKSLCQDLSNFDFKKAYALNELIILPDSIVLVFDTSEIGKNENYTVLNKVNHFEYRLDFWLMEKGGIVDPLISSCNLKIELNEKIVHFKICKKQADYFIENIGAKGKEKLLLKKIHSLPEVH